MTKIWWFITHRGEIRIRLYIPPTFEIGVGFHIAVFRYEIWVGLFFVSLSYNWRRG